MPTLADIAGGMLGDIYSKCSVALQREEGAMRKQEQFRPPAMLSFGEVKVGLAIAAEDQVRGLQMVSGSCKGDLLFSPDRPTIDVSLKDVLAVVRYYQTRPSHLAVAIGRALKYRTAYLTAAEVEKILPSFRNLAIPRVQFCKGYQRYLAADLAALFAPLRDNPTVTPEDFLTALKTGRRRLLSGLHLAHVHHIAPSQLEGFLAEKEIPFVRIPYRKGLTTQTIVGLKPK